VRAVARSDLERVTPLTFDLPATGLSANRLVLSLEDAALAYDGRAVLGPVELLVRGPERVAVVGRNGAGKSSLLKLIAGAVRPTAGRVRTCVPFAYLDQHVTLLRDEMSLIDNLKRSRPRIDDREAHRTLAAFAFRNSDALRRAGSLSGGERLRAGLACVMTASPTPQLLLLDEPTNHLDVTAVEELETALRIYDGALVLVSHDAPFVASVGVSRTLDLTG
jgi:ATPase subunit of ABC transporter with duplicated ATPase domains